ncbi:hypothetical protein [Paenibacillus sp. TSA_86.1]|uniref:hypothetical protein n=1 Tax=Paenibacillus sp. TSA_86.1 TaxID=3415649 RepID=UPI004045A67F
MKKHLDICHMSGQLGIHPHQLQAWLSLNGLTASDQQYKPDQRSERVTSPYRLAAPTSLSLAPSSRPSVRYRGRFSSTGSHRLSRSLGCMQHINKR